MGLILREVLLLLVGTLPFALGDYYYSGYSSPYGNNYTDGYSPPISLTTDPHETVNTSLRIAVRTDRFDEMKRLIEQEGASINAQSEAGSTALMHAAQNCSPKLIRYLLSKKADVNLRDRHGRTALMYASMDSCLEAVQLLTKTPGLEIGNWDHQGKTAMEYAGMSFQIKELLTSALEAKHHIKIAKRPSHHGKRVIN